jgi:adenosylmethionine-8-amino-7-oxononanoate aminotransferase
MDVMMKLSILHFKAIGQPQRVRFIARRGSYHGSSVAMLALGHNKRRRMMYTGVLALDGPNVSHVSRAHAFRDSPEGETEAEYVARLAEELELEFQRVGPETVCAFVAESIVGAVSSNAPCVSLATPTLIFF